MEQINFIYEAGETRRFHTMPVLRNQSVADHSWHVAMIAHVLYGQDEPGITMPFLMACLTHDMAECKVGDLPAPGKRAMGERYIMQDAKEPVPDEHTDFRTAWGEMEQEIQAEYQMDWEKFLTEEEKRRLKLCDVMEGALFCIKERRLGNQFIGLAFKNFNNYIGKLLEDVGDIPLPGEELTSERATTLREWNLFNFINYSWSEANGSR